MVFVAAWQVLRFSGEHVTADSYRTNKTQQVRYSRRVNELRQADYFCRHAGAAPAGDTVEIVGQRKGGQNHPAGLIVRASARYCAAYQDRQKTRISAGDLLECE